MDNNNPNFTVSLDNCGTSEKRFFGTLDDCIVIKFNNNDKKVSLKFLKNATDDVEVRFFDNINSKVYTSKSILKDDIMVCNDNDTSLLCIVNYLATGSTGFDINHNPTLTLMVDKKIPELVKSINSFFEKNKKLQRWRDIFKKYTKKYEYAEQELSSNVANESSSSSGNLGSENDPPKVTTQTESSSVADTPPHQPKETKYRKTKTTSGFKYYKLDPSGNVDYSTGYIEKQTTSGIKYYKLDPLGKVDYRIQYDNLPPEGGSHRRYRTTRRSRKYLSRRKSRRHIQRRKRTHRHKSRKSRK